MTKGRGNYNHPGLRWAVIQRFRCRDYDGILIVCR